MSLLVCWDCGGWQNTFSVTCAGCGAASGSTFDGVPHGLVDVADAIDLLGKSSGATEDARGRHSPSGILDGIMQWRGNSYILTKRLSRLLAKDMNEIRPDAESKMDHPLGLAEEWHGSRAEWRQALLAELEQACERQRAIIAECQADKESRNARYAEFAELVTNIRVLEGIIANPPEQWCADELAAVAAGLAAIRREHGRPPTVLT